MSRFLAGFVALVVLSAQGLAEEIKGKVKSIDAERGTIVLSVGDVERTFPVASEPKVFGLVGKKGKSQDVEGGLRGVKEGAEVTLSTEARDGKELATSVKVEGLAKVKKAKAEGSTKPKKKLAAGTAKVKKAKKPKADN